MRQKRKRLMQSAQATNTANLRDTTDSRKAAQRVNRLRRYEKNVRRDFAHQTSHALVTDIKAHLIVFEALGVQRMTRKPKAKRHAQGRWENNGSG